MCVGGGGGVGEGREILELCILGLAGHAIRSRLGAGEKSREILELCSFDLAGCAITEKQAEVGCCVCVCVCVGGGGG